VETAAIQVERHSNGSTIRVDGLVTAALVGDLRRLSAEDRSTRCDLRAAWLSADGANALRLWHHAAARSLELLLPNTIAAPTVQPSADPEPATPVDLPALLAHEVRGPLSVAHLRLQTLVSRLEGLGQADEAATCRSAIAGLEAVGRLFDTYLTASGPWSLQPVDLAVVCAEAADEARELTGRGSVDVAATGARAALWVRGERQALHQLVWNLVRNGLEAAEGEARVRVDLRASGDLAEVLVSDNGPGFPADVLAAPFEARRSQKAGGMGIGLILCRWIAERHQGQIRLGNTAQGARVQVLLPRAAAPA
jgi:signal transduction histidine kinase